MSILEIKLGKKNLLHPGRGWEKEINKQKNSPLRGPELTGNELSEQKTTCLQSDKLFLKAVTLSSDF